MRLTLPQHTAWLRGRPLIGRAVGPRVLSAVREYRLAWAVAAALFAWLMLFSWLQPLTEDEAVYMVVARGALHGQWPYRDLFDHKPPLAYLWYFPTGLGASLMWQRAFASLCAVASVPALALVARRWLGGRQAAVATVAYAALLANTGLAVRSNLESFMLLPLLAAFAVTSPLLAGLLLGVAVMTKPTALLFAPLLVLIWKRRTWQSAAGVLLVVGGVSLPFIPIWHDYWTANVVFNLHYGSMPLSERLPTLFTVRAPVFVGWLPLWGLLAIGALRTRDARPWLLAACGAAAVKSPGQQFDHYYALLAPGAAMLAVPGILWVWPRLLPRATLVAVALLALLPVALGFPSLIRNYDQNHHPLGDARRAIDATPGELYMLGDQEQPYVQAHRQPQRRFFFYVPATVEPRWGEQLRTDLLACPPAILVDAAVSLSIPWHDEITALYTRSIATHTGTVYLDPRTHCAR